MNAAGIAGIVLSSNRQTKIENCYNECDCSNGSTVGGIVGVDSSSDLYVLNCYNTGNILGNVAGGIIGNMQSTTLIEDCYNTGKIESYGSGNVGGISAHRWRNNNKLL